MKLLRYFRLLAAGLVLCLSAPSTNALDMTTMAAGSNSGTAAQFFTQKAVGNTWSYKSTMTCTGSQYCSSPTTTTDVKTITASSGSVITFQSTSDGYSHTYTEQIDASGAWTGISSDSTGTNWPFTVLPATFSVGTTWIHYPAQEYNSATTATIAAFNVTRTVPAGTFTDCLQINLTSTYTYSSAGYSSSSVYTETIYYSPTVGNEVESTWTSVSTFSDSYSTTYTDTYTYTYTYTSQLQSYSIANTSPALYTLAVTMSGSGSGTITSDTGGIDCGTSCWADYTSGTPVTLTATPSTGSFFAGWRGACSGTGSCVVTMDAAKDVIATFKPVPFVATTIKDITATSATITTTVSFNAADVGKTGAVYITAWAPASVLSALGVLSAPMNQAMSVTTTRDNPYSGGQINTRQETLASLLATADPNAFVLVQLTSTGWQLVANGQLIPYASGVLGDSMSALSILNNADPANLLGAQFCVGYGTSAAEMIAEGRMIPVADIPGATATTNGSCNVAANPYKGLWYNASESGWGMSVTQHDNINFVALYTYDQSAQPIWYVMSNCPIITAGSCTGDIYQVTGGTVPTAPWAPNPAPPTAGSGTPPFSDTNHGQFDFTLNGATGSKTIERQTFSSGTAAQALDYTDLWWNASESGWGVALTQDVGMIFAAWYTYDAAGQPIWYVASSCPLSGSGCTGDVYKVTGGGAATAA